MTPRIEGLATHPGNRSWPVTYAEFLAGKRRAEPHVVDMVVLRQVCALLRQKAAEARDGAPLWQLQSTSRLIEADEVIERYLTGLLREVSHG